jgi:hypothetical protein
MTTDLLFVEPSAAAPTINALLYGPPGTGKTTNACSAPDPILVGNAEGPGAIRFARQLWGDKDLREVEITGKDVLTQIYLYAKDPSNGIKTTHPPATWPRSPKPTASGRRTAAVPSA